jgi:hypothetical protein
MKADLSDRIKRLGGNLELDSVLNPWKWQFLTSETAGDVWEKICTKMGSRTQSIQLSKKTKVLKTLTIRCQTEREKGNFCPAVII